MRKTVLDLGSTSKCVKKILYQTSVNRPIDFKSLKMDWKKIIG